MGNVEQSESAGETALLHYRAIPVKRRCRDPRQDAVDGSVSKNAEGTFSVLNDDGIAEVLGESHRHLSHIAVLLELHSTTCTDKNVRAGT